ncbi:MAG: acyl-CoA dehydrogenase family protein, partial [Anaerolineae bacterium]|nr:acyl-CoA dehydrogenase family protein [Anaerolineae bacterium]
MDRLHFETEHDLFREAFREFLAREVVPHTEAWEKAGLVPKAVWRKAGRAGFLVTWADEEYGGAGARDFRYDQIVAEELAAANEGGLALGLHSTVVAPYLDHFGTPDQKRRYLTGAVSGDTILAIAMTEPAAGSDLAGMKTRAEPRDGAWVLNGAKTFISNGINADLVIVAAKTNPHNPRQIGLFLVEPGMMGFERGRKLEKLGHRAMDTAELFFTDVRVPAENVLGNPAEGFHYLMQLLADERLIEACTSIAMARAAYDMTLGYVKERTAFGQRIGSFQYNRFRLADMKTEIDIGQVFVDRCVMDHNAGRLSAEIAAEAKLYTTELLGRVADQCVQLHGGYGFMLEYPITRLFASARVHRIWAGSSEIMREIIGRS